MNWICWLLLSCNVKRGNSSSLFRQAQQSEHSPQGGGLSKNKIWFAVIQKWLLVKIIARSLDSSVIYIGSPFSDMYVCEMACSERMRLSWMCNRENVLAFSTGETWAEGSSSPYQPTQLLHTQTHAVAVSHDLHEVKENDGRHGCTRTKSRDYLNTTHQLAQCKWHHANQWLLASIHC